MRLLSFILTLLFAAAASAAGFDAAFFTFSTPGPDRYADGTAVMDGECYALVWSKDGEFEGFSADGRALDEKDKVLIVAPVAKDGRCPDMLFQLSAAKVESCAGGRFAVYLMDTRLAAENGTMSPRGADEAGRLVLLNGYGKVDAEISRISSYAPVTAGVEAGGNAVTSAAAAPSDVVQPRVKNLKIEGENVVLTVENLPGFMRVQGGGDLKSLNCAGVARETPGSAEDVKLTAPKMGGSGFYRVIFNATP